MKLILCLLLTIISSSLMPAYGTEYTNVSCKGEYKYHLQGICTDQQNSIYWCYTTWLVKTDQQGNVQSKVEVANHHGDLCYSDGKLYVAVNLGRFNDPQGNADSWVYIYDAKDLSFISKHQTDEVFYGAGGIGVRKGHFFIVGGLPNQIRENYVYEYDDQLKFIKKHIVNSGHTTMGIQTATFNNDRWYFGCYGKVLLITDAQFKMKGRKDYNCSLGIEGLANGDFLSATGHCQKNKGCTGKAIIVSANSELGLTEKADGDE